MAVGLARSAITAWRSRISRVRSSDDPWEVLILTTSTPASRSFLIASWELEAGPTVATILVRRMGFKIPTESEVVEG